MSQCRCNCCGCNTSGLISEAYEYSARVFEGPGHARVGHDHGGLTGLTVQKHFDSRRNAHERPSLDDPMDASQLEANSSNGFQRYGGITLGFLSGLNEQARTHLRLRTTLALGARYESSQNSST